MSRRLARKVLDIELESRLELKHLYAFEQLMAAYACTDTLQVF
jgi:hypothetical protein